MTESAVLSSRTPVVGARFAGPGGAPSRPAQLAGGDPGWVSEERVEALRCPAVDLSRGELPAAAEHVAPTAVPEQQPAFLTSSERKSEQRDGALLG